MRVGTLFVLALAACTVGVDGNESGLSAGSAGPMGGTTTAGASGDAAPTTAADATGADGSGDPTAASADSGSPATGDSGAADATGPDPDTGTPVTGSDGPGTTDDGGSDTAPGDPLHPDLDTPTEGETCTTPGSLGECPALEVCRFHTSEQGLCESCDACGNLGAFCTVGTDCDILFACFQGRCTNFCELGTFACGPVEDCLDVGHPTHGVCRP